MDRETCLRNGAGFFLPDLKILLRETISCLRFVPYNNTQLLKHNDMDNVILTPITPAPFQSGYIASYDLTAGVGNGPLKVHHEITLTELKGGFVIQSTMWSNKNEVLVDESTSVMGPFPINLSLFTKNASLLKAEDKETLTRRLGAQVRNAVDCLAEEDILDAKGIIYGLVLTTMAFG